jgi:NAD-dependent deacetylase
MDSATLARARALVADARRIVVLTGAGVSAESGVPTFRGTGGLWKTFRAEELATRQAFARDPRLVWEWYAWRRELVARCAPNAAHHALARLALARDGLGSDGGVTIATQNVDGLHARAAREAAREAAGAAGEARADPAPAMPLELHGNLFATRCADCGADAGGDVAVDATSPDTLPRCERCGGLLRPGVVWFGEMLDSRVLGAATAAAAAADVALVVGTSAVVHPAAGLASHTLAHGGAVIEVNPDATPLSGRATVALRGLAGELVPTLVA